jgi:hypothetical protein
MNILGGIEFLRRHIGTLKKVLITYLVVLVLLDVILHLEEGHGHYLIDRVWAFWTFFGIVGCFLLIKIAKGIAHLFLSKSEDYYG